MTDETIGCIPVTPNLQHRIDYVLHENMNRLKARMLNLAEAVATETRQCNAVKGLMKDALNQAYYDSVHAIRREVELSQDSRSAECLPIPALQANSLADILLD